MKRKVKKTMNKLLSKVVLFGALAFAIVAGGCGVPMTERVDPGNVGVKVNLWGSDKGVEAVALTPGLYFKGPWTYIYEFPTFEQNFVFTRADTRASPGDESVYFQSIEGMQVSVDIGLRYRLSPEKIPVLFQTYRLGVNEITRGPIRNMIRDAMVIHGSRMTVESLVGPGKQKLIDAVEEEVRKNLAQIGVEILGIALISEVRVPNEVLQSINAKLRASQIALQRETEIQEAKAAAQKLIEAARGEAESVRLKAIAEADALNIRGEALRKNPEILQLESIQKWNGMLPTYYSGGGQQSPMPFLQMLQQQQGK
jgi:regulator of protease activity HflC (stomatin/prohibitin superfamily)